MPTPKKGVAQRRNERRKIITTNLSFALTFIIGLVFAVLVFQNTSLLINWENGGVLEYQGQYTIEKDPLSLRSINYKITLSNGDVLKIHSNHIQNRLLVSNDEKIPAHLEELSFRYSSYKKPIHGTHTVISITSMNGSSEFVNEAYMKSVITAEIIVYSVLALLSFAPLFFMWILYHCIRHTGGRGCK